MHNIEMFFAGLFQTIQSLVDFLIKFLTDTVGMVVTLTKLPVILGTVLQWTNSLGILPYITCIIGLAIVYKILGRD